MPFFPSSNSLVFSSLHFTSVLTKFRDIGSNKKRNEVEMLHSAKSAKEIGGKNNIFQLEVDLAIKKLVKFFIITLLKRWNNDVFWIEIPEFKDRKRTFALFQTSAGKHVCIQVAVGDFQNNFSYYILIVFWVFTPKWKFFFRDSMSQVNISVWLCLYSCS